MTWQNDLNTIRDQSAILTHHKTLMGYTQTSVRAGIKEMRDDDGAMSDVMHERADECETALEALLEFHNS
jgi:hypothetical protein